MYGCGTVLGRNCVSVCGVLSLTTDFDCFEHFLHLLVKTNFFEGAGVRARGPVWGTVLTAARRRVCLGGGVLKNTVLLRLKNEL